MNNAQSVLNTLDEYAEAYCAKDVERIMDLFSDEDEISVIGTGADELCSGGEQIRALFQRNFEEATAHHFEWDWRHVTIAGDCAVVATTLTIQLRVDNDEIQVPLRWTVCLIKCSENWKWLHRHASSAAATQEEGAAYPHASQ